MLFLKPLISYLQEKRLLFFLVDKFGYKYWLSQKNDKIICFYFFFLGIQVLSYACVLVNIDYVLYFISD